MTWFYKILKLIAALAVVFLPAIYNADAQHFTNNAGGTYTASCNAVIVMKSDTGVFNGTEQLGTSSVTRIEGTVDWAATNPQTVQGLYYTNLFLSGGTKTIADGVHVFGEGCATPLAGYPQLTGGVGYYATSGNRTYLGTFTYDGDTPQTIFPENGGPGSNIYKGLDLAGNGIKNTLADVKVDSNLNVGSTTALYTNGNFSLNGTGTADGPISIRGGTFSTTGSGTFTANDSITVNPTGGLDLGSTGIFTLATGQVLRIVDSASTPGTFNMNANTAIVVNGSFENTNTTRDNMTFDCTSSFTYSSATPQTILGNSNASASNRYGKLFFAGAGVKTADGSVYTCGDTVSVSGGQIVMGSSVDGPYLLDVLATGKTYSPIMFASANNDEYIQGRVGLSGTIPTGVEFNLNNAQTRVTFDTTASLTAFELDVQPNTAPTNLSNFDNTSDVNRLVKMNFSGTGSLSDLRVGYTSSDLASFTGNESKLRPIEGYNASNTGQKLTGGSGLPIVSGATDPRYVELASTTGMQLISGSGGGTIQQLTSGSDLVLTSRPLIFIAVNNGRWTNPGTWDEGAVPDSASNTILRALVYAGIAGPAFGTPSTNNTTPESNVYSSGIMANSIVVDSNYTNAALIVGNEDNPNSFVFSTQLNGNVEGTEAGFYNNNATANSGDWNNKSTTPGANTVNGLFISTIVNSGKTAAFGAAKVINAGTIVNNGKIVVGQ